jgi:hypothetical protein
MDIAILTYARNNKIERHRYIHFQIQGRISIQGKYLHIVSSNRLYSETPKALYLLPIKPEK